MMKQNRWFFVLMAALVVASCLSMPVMAEKMIERDLDKVMSDGTPIVDTEGKDTRKTLTTTQQPLIGHKLSQQALEALEAMGRASYFEVFAEQIPDTHKALEADAYEEDGVMSYVLSLMPIDWEDSTDTLSVQERMPFYTIQFKDVDTEQGTGEIIGLQRYWLNNDANDVVEASYTEAQLADMEAAARTFAKRIGKQPGELIETGNVAGSYEPGCILVFELGDDKTVSVTVSVANEISGYSMVRGKG